MTTAIKYQVGDRVTFPPDALVKQKLIGVTFRVESVPTGRKQKYGIRAEAGGPVYGVRAEDVIPASDDAPSLGRPFVPVEFFNVGEVVTVTSASGKVSPSDVFVVFKDNGSDRINITRLGGADGTTYYRWPRAGLVKRDLAWLTERLVEMA